MKITFERSGGFAGMRMAIELDSDRLQPQDAAVLQKLVKDADFFNMSASHSSQSRRDGFHYIISVEADGKQHSLQLSEGSVPDALQPLVNHLVVRAQNQRRVV